MFQPQASSLTDGGMASDEVEQYPTFVLVTSSGFLDLLSRCLKSSEYLPVNFQMVLKFLGTSATSLPSEPVKIIAGRVLNTVLLSFSCSEFVMILRFRSRIDSIVLKTLLGRATVAAAVAAGTKLEKIIDETRDGQERCKGKVVEISECI